MRTGLANTLYTVEQVPGLPRRSCPYPERTQSLDIGIYLVTISLINNPHQKRALENDLILHHCNFPSPDHVIAPDHTFDQRTTGPHGNAVDIADNPCGSPVGSGESLRRRPTDIGGVPAWRPAGKTASTPAMQLEPRVVPG